MPKSRRPPIPEFSVHLSQEHGRVPIKHHFLAIIFCSLKCSDAMKRKVKMLLRDIKTHKTLIKCNNIVILENKIHALYNYNSV